MSPAWVLVLGLLVDFFLSIWRWEVFIISVGHLSCLACLLCNEGEVVADDSTKGGTDLSHPKTKLAGNVD